jgi:hypothetical protein
MLLQRPTAAYYRIETELRWPATGCNAAAAANATAGIIARELNSGAGIAIGLMCNGSNHLQIAAWQDTLNLLHAVPFPHGVGGQVGGQGDSVIRLRIDVELVLAQVWYSIGGGAWTAVPAFNTNTSDPSYRGSEMTFEYASTYMSWQAVGPDPAAWEHVDKKAPTDAFTTLHPGLFAGGSMLGGNHSVIFDYFRYTDHEVFAEDEPRVKTV